MIFDRVICMARNFRELQAKMEPANQVENEERVREELERMALEQPPPDLLTNR